MNRNMIIDLINCDVIALFFLIMPYSNFVFLILIFWLIVDLIELYITEKREVKDSFEIVEDYKYDHWEG